MKLDAVIARSAATKQSRDRRELRVPLDCSHGDFLVKGGVCDGVASFGAGVAILGSSPFARSGVAPDQPHIRSSRFQRLHHDSAFGGGAREAGPFFASAFLSQAIHRFADPDRPGLISPRQIRRGGLRFLGRGQAEVFMTAPSMTTPALVNFHSATNSLRASATISRLRAALPVMPGRRR